MDFNSDEKESVNSSKDNRKYFAGFIYDALFGPDDPIKRELAIGVLTGALEKFVKDVIAEERNKMFLEIRREVIKDIEEYIKNSIANHEGKILDNTSLMIDMLQKINETKNLAKGSQAITRDTNEKSEMIIEHLERLENVLKEKIKEIDEIVKHSKESELTTMDKQILNFIKEKGIVCADDVQKAFKYKGKNAASARLNILYRKNKLEKLIKDRKVYYQIAE